MLHTAIILPANSDSWTNKFAPHLLKFPTSCLTALPWLSKNPPTPPPKAPIKIFKSLPNVSEVLGRQRNVIEANLFAPPCKLSQQSRHRSRNSVEPQSPSPRAVGIWVSIVDLGIAA